MGFMDKMKEMKTKASVNAVGMRDRAKEMMNSPSGQTAPRFSTTSRNGGEESATTTPPPSPYRYESNVGLSMLNVTESPAPASRARDVLVELSLIHI